MSDYPMLISNKLHSFRNFNLTKIQESPIILFTPAPFQNLGICSPIHKTPFVEGNSRSVISRFTAIRKARANALKIPSIL